MNRISRSKVDAFGMLSSGLCAVHCAGLPILLSLGLLGGMNHLTHDRVELFVLIASIILAIWSSIKGWQDHGRWAPQLAILVGIVFLVIGFSGVTHFLMACGGFLLVMGHWLNYRLQTYTI